MRIVDDALLAEFRQKPECEWCHDSVYSRSPHHIFTRGAGQADIRENLITLCFICHRRNHGGMAPRQMELLAIVAAREQTTPDAIEAKVQLIRRTPKPLGWQDMTPAQLVAYALAPKPMGGNR